MLMASCSPKGLFLAYCYSVMMNSFQRENIIDFVRKGGTVVARMRLQ